MKVLAAVAALGLAACAPRPPASPPITADQAYEAGNFGDAEALYRSLLATPRAPGETLRILRRIGSCLQARHRYADAREAFAHVLAYPVEGEAAHLWSPERNQKGWAQIGIAECFEAEGRWTEALEAYVVSHTACPVRGECGNGNLDQQQRELDSIARCVRRLDGR